MSRGRPVWAEALVAALLVLPSCGGEPGEPDGESEPGCAGCSCADPDWSCDAGTRVDAEGHAVELAPEAGFFQVDAARLF